MNKKIIIICIGIWFLFAGVIFIIYTLKCKDMADIILNDTYNAIQNSNIIKQKLGKVKQVNVKSIYNLGKEKNGKFYTEIKIITENKTHYITAIIDNKTSKPTGYIINGKTYSEKENQG